MTLGWALDTGWRFFKQSQIVVLPYDSVYWLTGTRDEVKTKIIDIGNFEVQKRPPSAGKRS
jgi:hypothetical protein